MPEGFTGNIDKLFDFLYFQFMMFNFVTSDTRSLTTTTINDDGKRSVCPGYKVR